MDPVSDSSNQPADKNENKPQTPDPVFSPTVPVSKAEPVVAASPAPVAANLSSEVKPEISPAMQSTGTAIEFSSNPFIAFGKGYGAALLNNPLPTLTIGFILALIFIIGYFVSLFLIAAVAALSPILGVLLAIGGVVFAIWLAANFCIKIIHILVHSPDEKFSYSELSRFNKPGSTFKLIVGSIVGSIATFIGLLLFIIPGIILAARFSLMPYVIAEEGLGPIRALKRSWALTKSNTWNMIGANFTDSLFPGNSFMIAGFFAAKANRYQELVALEKANQTNKNTHWLNYVMAIFPAMIIFGILSLLVITTIAGVNNLANDAKNSPINGDFQINGSSLNSDLNSYCYVVGDGANISTECVDKATCKTVEACKSFYGESLN